MSSTICVQELSRQSQAKLHDAGEEVFSLHQHWLRTLPVECTCVLPLDIDCSEAAP